METPETDGRGVEASPQADWVEIRVRAQVRRSRMDEAADGRILRVIEDVNFQEADIWGYDLESQEVYDPSGVELVLSPGVIRSIPNIVRVHLEAPAPKGG